MCFFAKRKKRLHNRIGMYPSYFRRGAKMSFLCGSQFFQTMGKWAILVFVDFNGLDTFPPMAELLNNSFEFKFCSLWTVSEILFGLTSEFYQCEDRHWIWMLKCDNWLWHLRIQLLGPFWNNFRHCALVEEYQIPCCPTNSELKYQQKQSAKLRLKNIAALLFLQLILVTNIWTGQHFSNQGILTLSAVAYRW